MIEETQNSAKTEIDVLLELAAIRGIKNAKAEDIAEFLELKRIRAEINAMQKQEKGLRDAVISKAKDYQGFVQVFQCKDYVKTNWEQVVNSLAELYKIPSDAVQSMIKSNGESKPGTTQLHILI